MSDNVEVSSELTAYGAVELGKNQFDLIANKDRLVSWAEESQFAVQALNKNAMLQRCAPKSIQESIINVAAIGLSLNPSFGYSYLVPESIKLENSWIKVCQLRVSFKGLVKIATDSGAIKFVRTEIVKENDEFTYKGPMSSPEHKMNPFSDRGKIIGVYCIAKTPDGEVLTDVMGVDDINKIRSAAKQDSVWAKWFEEMAKKAIIKRASKYWPLGDASDRFSRAVNVVNESEGSEPIPANNPNVTANLPKPKAEKPLLSDEGLEAAMAKIKNGDLTVEKLLSARNLTVEQIKKLDEVAND